MAIDNDHKNNKKLLLFIWIPKTGGTSMREMLKIPFWHRDPTAKPQPFWNDSNVTFGHADILLLKKEKLISQKFYDTSFKFCIVRNPYDRAVSLFYYQRRLHKKYDFKSYMRFLAKNKHRIPKNTIYNLSDKGCPHQNRGTSPHGHCACTNNQWNQMVSWIPNDINKIFRFENFSNIPSQINNLSGNNFNVTKIEHLNCGNHKPYRAEYDEATKKLVYEIYKDDFERFGYEF